MNANRHLPVISHKGAGALDASLSAGAADTGERAGDAWLAYYNPAAASLDKMSEIRSLSEHDLALLRRSLSNFRSNSPMVRAGRRQAKKSLGQRLRQLFTLG